MQAVKSLLRLHKCAGLSEPLLISDVIGSKIFSAGSFSYDSSKPQVVGNSNKYKLLIF